MTDEIFDLREVHFEDPRAKVSRVRPIMVTKEERGREWLD